MNLFSQLETKDTQDKNTTSTDSKGKYDSRNTINDLTGKEWLKLTSSFWISEKCVLDKDALKTPCPIFGKRYSKTHKSFYKKRYESARPILWEWDYTCGSET